VGEASEELTDRQRRVAELVERIAGDVPIAPEERSSDQKARWVLANLLDRHRREKKSLWWEYFRLADLPTEDLFDERAALSGLQLAARVGGTVKAPIDRYSFPAQETDLRGGEPLRVPGGARLGVVDNISVEGGWIDVKKRKDTADTHPEAVFGHNVINDDVLADSLLRLGNDVAAHGWEHAENVAGRDVWADPSTYSSRPVRLSATTTSVISSVVGFENFRWTVTSCPIRSGFAGSIHF